LIKAIKAIKVNHWGSTDQSEMWLQVLESKHRANQSKQSNQIKPPTFERARQIKVQLSVNQSTCNQSKASKASKPKRQSKYQVDQTRIKAKQSNQTTFLFHLYKHQIKAPKSK